MYSIYFIMFSDYFTVVEEKRYGGAMTIALGVGAMTGSLLISLLTRFVEARRLFLALPLLVGITLAQLVWLTRREQPLNETESAPEEGIVESLKALPKLSRRYPIVLLMAVATLTNIAGQCFMEFEAFSIYANTFPVERELASFLGKMTAAVDFVGILIVFFVTNPMIPRLGVAATSMVAPAINFASFLILAASSSLPAGILAHLNYYPLEHSLNVPVFTLTYNALPHRFIGRVRVINDGVIYPIALASAGLVLLMIENLLSLSQVAIVGAGGAVLYLLAQWGIGRQYLRGLLEILRSGAIDLDQVGEGFKLPREYFDDILAMLKSNDREFVVLGIGLALRCDIALSVPDFERILPMAPIKVARSTLAVIGKNSPLLAGRQLRMLIGSSVSLVRALALEALVIRRLGVEQLEPLLDDKDEHMRAVAAAGLVASGSAATPKLRELLSSLELEVSALAALYVLRAVDCSRLSSVLEALGAHASAAVRAEALSMAAVAGAVGDAELLNWGRRAYNDPEGSVRAAAAALLVRVAADDDLTRICRDLFAAPGAEIRRSSALALGRRGGLALSVLAEQLRSADYNVASEIMDGIGMSGTETADGILFAFLSDVVFPAVTRNLHISSRLPSGRLAWRALEIAIADSNAHALQSVLHALEVLGYKRVLTMVKTTMMASDPRTRANAIETLSSLAHRRYVLPLLPLLEAEESDGAGDVAFDAEDASALLTELMADQDPFVRAGAITVWSAEFGARPDLSRSVPSPLVTATVQALAKRASLRSYDEEFPMNCLAFLKSVPLFSEMTLDPLMAVDAAMTRETYLQNEQVISEGDHGNKLYIVYRGELAIRKRVSETEDHELARLTSGQIFGEMALFDDRERRSATVVAVRESELLALDREHFRSLAYQRPDIPMEICKVLASRLRIADLQL